MKALAQSFPECLSLIPPVWELNRYVAVNPFWGWGQLSFEEAMRQLEVLTKEQLLPPSSGTLAQVGPQEWHADDPVGLLGPFLASYFGESAIVPPPWKHLSLWMAWKDSLPGSAGLGWRRSRRLLALVNSLPESPSQALELLVPGTNQPINGEKVISLLGLAPGWASYLRQRCWPQEPTKDSELATLAAMLAAVTQICPVPGEESSVKSAPEPFSQRLVALQQREERTRKKLQAQLSEARINPEDRAQAQVRAAFCIDVRSEVYRRHWEAFEPRVATDGFAGFFGIPASWEGEEGHESLLPVLLVPQLHLKGKTRRPRASKLIVSGTPNFPLVEVTGWSAIPKLARFSGAYHPSVANYGGLEDAIRAIPQAEKAPLALSLLTNLGWLGRWTPLMIFVGHESASVNNPHAASLDCGACGGKSGHASARLAAALLNDVQTRSALAQQGVQIPETTLFAAAVHNTTSDTFTFVSERNPQLTDWEQALRSSWEKAQRATQREKQERFSFLSGSASKRSRDEAQTRPEPALAGNVALIAVPASWTRKVNGEGKVFLHSYDPDRDDGKILELILTAPAIVASWINLQYFASTTAPQYYGAGNKLLHSRIGDLGVVEGLGGDLKVGLPEQSVAWGGVAYHEPLRLSVLVTAPWEKVDAILKAHPEAAQWYEGGWACLSVEHAGQWKTRHAGRWI